MGGVRDPELTALIERRAQDWFGADRNCQAWEPGGDEFLSSALTEALLMSRLLPGPAFAAWFEAFLPRVGERQPATLFTPAVVSDRTDGKIVHLDGLNLSRAWCWRGIAARLGETHPFTEAAVSKRRGASRRQPTACRRRLYGRALAGEFRAAGPELTRHFIQAN